MQVPGRTESRGRAPRTGCSAAIVSLASVFVAKVPLGSAFLLFYQGPDWRCAEATRLSSVGFDWFAQDIQRCSTILSNFAYPRFQGYAARPPGCVPLEPRVRSTPSGLRTHGTEGTQCARPYAYTEASINCAGRRSMGSMSSLHNPPPSDASLRDLNVAEQILERAAEIRSLGEYIGFWEWLCWSHTAQARVYMLIGRDLYDVQEIFAPTLPVLAVDAPVHIPVATQVRHGVSFSIFLNCFC